MFLQRHLLNSLIVSKIVMIVKILTSEPFPIGLAASNRIMSYAKGFIRNNCGVSVICMKPTENPKQVFNFNPSGIVDGISYEYSCGKTTRSFHFINRRIDNIKGIYKICLDLLKEKRSERTDVIIYYSTSTSRALLLFWITRIKKILYLKEESEMPEVYYLHMSFLQRIFFKNVHYQLFDGLLLMTKRLIRYFQTEKKLNKQFIHVPMTVDAERFINIGKNKSRGKYIAYCGVLNNKKDGIDMLIEAFVLISTDFPEVNLYLIGESSSDEEFKSYLEKVKLNHLMGRIIFTGRVSKDSIPEFLCNASILIMPRPESIQAEGGFPTKLGEYLATGNPVVVTKVGEISEYLTDGKNVFMAKPGNIESLITKIKEILTDYEKAKEIGIEGQKTAMKYFNYINQAKLIIDFIGSIKLKVSG
jgi:glycosyltransferase involved in cell wall biosynthesis